MTEPTTLADLGSNAGLELKPCPFCGQSEWLRIYHDPLTILRPWYRVECENCGAHGPGSDCGDHIEWWNKRGT